jgi:hypothetical protein
MQRIVNTDMDNQTEHQRFAGPDVLKGFVIFAIVMVHIVLNAGPGIGGSEPALILQILYLGLMAYFIYSGYFYKEGTGFKYNMKKRVSQILIALILCAVIIPLILFVWLLILGYPMDFYDLGRGILSGLDLNNAFMPFGSQSYYPYCSGAVGYYFLWVMLFAFVIFYGIIEAVLDDIKKIIAVIVALLLIQSALCYFLTFKLPFTFELVPIAASFMFLGALMRKYDLIAQIESLELRNKRYWMPFIVCLVVGVVLCLIVHPGLRFDKMTFGSIGPLSTFTYIIEAGCMCVVYMYIATFISKIPVLSKALEICGQHTMGVLLYHGSIATAIFALLTPLSHESWFPTLPMTTRAIIGIVTFVLCILICMYGPKLVGRLRKKDADTVSS